MNPFSASIFLTLLLGLVVYVNALSKSQIDTSAIGYLYDKPKHRFEIPLAEEDEEDNEQALEDEIVTEKVIAAENRHEELDKEEHHQHHHHNHRPEEDHPHSPHHEEAHPHTHHHEEDHPHHHSHNHHHKPNEQDSKPEYLPPKKDLMTPETEERAEELEEEGDVLNSRKRELKNDKIKGNLDRKSDIPLKRKNNLHRSYSVEGGDNLKRRPVTGGSPKRISPSRRKEKTVPITLPHHLQS